MDTFNSNDGGAESKQDHKDAVLNDKKQKSPSENENGVLHDKEEKNLVEDEDLALHEEEKEEKILSNNKPAEFYEKQELSLAKIDDDESMITETEEVVLHENEESVIADDEQIVYEDVVHHVEEEQVIYEEDVMHHVEGEQVVYEDVVHHEEEEQIVSESEVHYEQEENIVSETVLHDEEVEKSPEKESLELHEVEEKTTEVEYVVHHEDETEEVFHHEEAEHHEESEKISDDQTAMDHEEKEKSSDLENSVVHEEKEKSPCANESALHPEEKEINASENEVEMLHEAEGTIIPANENITLCEKEENIISENMEVDEEDEKVPCENEEVASHEEKQKVPDQDESLMLDKKEESPRVNEDVMHQEEEEKGLDDETLVFSEKEETPRENEEMVHREETEEEEGSAQNEYLALPEIGEMETTAEVKGLVLHEKGEEQSFALYESSALHENEEKETLAQDVGSVLQEQSLALHENEENETLAQDEGEDKEDSSSSSSSDSSSSSSSSSSDSSDSSSDDSDSSSSDEEDAEKSPVHESSSLVEEAAPEMSIVEEAVVPQVEEEKEEEMLFSDEEEPEIFRGFDSMDLDLPILSRSVLRRLIAQAEFDYQEAAAKRPKLTLTIRKTGDNVMSTIPAANNYSAYYDSNADSITEANYVTSQSTKPSRKSLSQAAKLAKSDVNNPAFREPFNHGWIREMVYRAATPENPTASRQADVYYYSPSGKKVRSSREIAKHLNAGLTVNNFTFFKESLNVNDPTKEIIREANNPLVSKLSTKVAGSKKVPQKRTKTTIKLKPPPLPLQPADDTVPSHIITTEAEVHAVPPHVNMNLPRDSSVVKKPIKINVQDPCSIRCLASVGSIPSLQCKVCLCLYHPECTDSTDSTNFVCKNCRTETTPPVNNVPTISSWDNLTSETLTSETMTSAPRTPIEHSSLPPQNVAVVKGKRYIVIPHNFDSYQTMGTSMSDEWLRSQSPTIIDPGAESYNDDDDDDDEQDSQDDFEDSPMLAKIRSRKQMLIEQRNRRFFMDSTCTGYNALTQIFQYLPLHDLLRATQVCRMWRDLAESPSVWRRVSLENDRITDWDAFAETLRTRGTEYLDLRGLLILGDPDDVWFKLVSILPTIKSLVELKLSECPFEVVQEIMKNCPWLQVLNASSIRCDSISLEQTANLTSCRDLRLKTISGAYLEEDLTPLMSLTQLKHLTLTSISELGTKNVGILKFLQNLESLELGECTEFPERFGSTVLQELKNLRHLRLEKGQGTECIFDILDSISTLEKLSQLELINFDVKSGFHEHLGNCKNLRRLLIIPTYVSQAGTTNNMLIGGVIRLSDSLTHFAWGVTEELLKTTELFADQYSKKPEQVTEDSIPVLKPVPIEETLKDETSEQGGASPASTSKVEIMPLTYLEKLLVNAMPKTRVMVLKIPFVAAAKQNLSSCIS